MELVCQKDLRWGKCLLAVILTAVAVMSQAADIKFEARSLFRGSKFIVGASPIKIVISNTGPDAVGVFEVSENSYRASAGVASYPIEVPKGSTKSLVVYPSNNGYSTPQIIFKSNRGTFTLEAQEEDTASGIEGLVISDQPGALMGLSVVNPRNTNGIVIANCTPQDAPPRLAGYVKTGFVVLGSGAERISDSVVSALKDYLLIGGNVILMGGAGSVTLLDRRWSELSPLDSVTVRTVSSPGRMIFAGSELKSPVTIVSGNPKPGVKVFQAGNTFVASYRVYGMGKLYVLGPDLAEEPMTSWSGSSKLLTGILGRSPASVQNSMIGANMSEDSADAIPYGGGSGEQSPFEIQIPKAETVLQVLISFIVVVVPINFFILRKLKKLEWAWFTSPLICVGFAMIFLVQARSLYSAKLVTASQGIVIESANSEGAVYTGGTEMFFPSGGTYDLKLSNVQYVGGGYGGGDYSYDEPASTYPSLVSDKILMPEFKTKNLSFEKLRYIEPMDQAKFLSISKIREGKKVVLTIKNVSKFEITEIGLEQPRSQTGKADPKMISLKPGQSTKIEVKKQGVAPPKDAYQRFAGFAIVVSGTIKKIRPGPQVGDVDPGRDRVRLISVFNTDLKEVTP